MASQTSVPDIATIPEAVPESDCALSSEIRLCLGKGSEATAAALALADLQPWTRYSVDGRDYRCRLAVRIHSDREGSVSIAVRAVRFEVRRQRPSQIAGRRT